jgi:hypothetical protein
MTDWLTRRIGCAMLQYYIIWGTNVCRSSNSFTNFPNKKQVIESNLLNAWCIHGIFALTYLPKGVLFLALANIEQFFSQQTAQKVHIHTCNMHYIFQG